MTIDDRIAALEATLAELRAQRDKPAPTRPRLRPKPNAADVDRGRALLKLRGIPTR